MPVPKVDPERLYTRVRELCAIRAPSRCERAVRDYLYLFFSVRESHGLTWEEMPESSIPSGGDTANILMRVSGTSTPLLLCAHMDTVSLGMGKPVIVERQGELRTDGTSILGGDDRAGIALALEIIDLCLDDAERRQSLEVVFTVQEELGCLGAGTLAHSQFSSSFAFNLDGETPVGTAIVSAPQKARFTCDVHGRAAHAALEPLLGRNAIRLASEMILQLPQGQVDPSTTMNIGMVEGGQQTNVVPDFATFTGELRSFSPESFRTCNSLVNSLCSQFGQRDGFSVEVAWEFVYAGYTIDEDALVVRRFARACKSLGYSAELLRSAGGGDANKLNSLGIPTIVFGIGMHHIHTNREYLVLEELLEAARLLREAVFGI
ncbi:MAG: hypothetical protein CVV46_09190 [Spirochaetae bacterium HGW-Spirochaetae-2]|jgi:tripeptide aminopeptidase|nr:MAG: hypothetical protein CVV46_09190 [Spirochaetae bacterium HGW-Spirochaetae-2]